MKKISYLDMVHELISESEFSQFEEYYIHPITKSIKILNHRGIFKINNSKSSDIYDNIKESLSQERDFLNPEFHSDGVEGKKYSDVTFAIRKKGLLPDSLGNNFLHQAGLIYVQEMSAGLSAQVLGVQKGDVVLDMCAAPGGKSIQIADKLTEGFLISNELDSSRLNALKSNLHRCGIFNVGITHQDGRVFGEKLPEFFDKILVDAPCSGEGMQYKSGKKIYQRDEKKCQQLSNLQTQLLISGLKALKVGGEIVYSTCTTNPLENEIVVENVLKFFGDKIELLNVEIKEKSEGISHWRDNEILSQSNCKKVARFRPHIQHTGGFFIAKIRKLSSFYCDGMVFRSSNMVLTDDKFLNQVREKLSYRGIQKNDKLLFFEDKFTINVYPNVINSADIKNKFPEIQTGLPIFKIVKDSKSQEKKLIPLVGIAQMFGSIATNNTIDISDDQVQYIMQKRDLISDLLEKYEGKTLLLKRKGIGVGMISVQKGIGKNKSF